MLRVRVFAAGIASLALGAEGASGGVPRSIVDRSYDCKIIASTREFPDGPDWLGPPTMNTWGQVVFLAVTRVGANQDTVSELRVGRGDQIGGVPISRAIAKAGDNGSTPPLAPFGGIEEAAIEDSARVVFLATDPADGGPAKEAIYRAFTNQPSGSKPPSILADRDIDPTSEFVGFDPLDTLGANPHSIVFQGITDLGVAYYRDGVEIARNGTNGVQIVNPPVLLHRGQPWTAFLASLDGPAARQAIFVNGVQRAESTASGEGGFAGLSLSGNAAAVAAYSRSGFPGIDTWELVATGPIGTSVLVDADEDPFEPFADPLETSINVWGEVAFVSSPEGDGDTLLVADGSSVIRRVRCQNQDAIFGAAFFDLSLSPHAINSDGQIAFRGNTFQQRFLVRADPLPGQGAPPTSCAGQLEGARCDDGDAITQSSCQSNACAGDPLYDPPASCASLDDGSVCNDGDPATISFCEAGTCVGMPLPVPEPAAIPLLLAALASLGGIRVARPERWR